MRFKNYIQYGILKNEFNSTNEESRRGRKVSKVRKTIRLFFFKEE